MTPLPAVPPQDLLNVWFKQTRPRQWFAADPAFDALLAQRYATPCGRAISGELHHLAERAGQCSGPRAAAGSVSPANLAGQGPRRRWPGPGAQPAGPGARAGGQRADPGAAPVLADAPDAQRRSAVQRRGLPLFRRFCDARTAGCARRHAEVIARFGRFPHRNTALGRASSPTELVFLQMPGSRFRATDTKAEIAAREQQPGFRNPAAFLTATEETLR